MITAGPRCVELEMVDVRLIFSTNNKVHMPAVKRMVAEGLDPDRFGALPAYFDGRRWIITDGNHRLEFAKTIGVQYIPVAPLTRQEYAYIAFSKTNTVDLLIKVPDQPKYHTFPKPTPST